MAVELEDKSLIHSGNRDFEAGEFIMWVEKKVKGLGTSTIVLQQEVPGKTLVWKR